MAAAITAALSLAVFEAVVLVVGVVTGVIVAGVVVAGVVVAGVVAGVVVAGVVFGGAAPDATVDDTAERGVGGAGKAGEADWPAAAGANSFGVVAAFSVTTNDGVGFSDAAFITDGTKGGAVESRRCLVKR